MAQLNRTAEEINQLLDRIDEILSTNSILTDAPSDGNIYGRQGNTWVKINN